MTTLKRKNADGTWDYIQVTGNDVNGLKQTVDNHTLDIGEINEQLAQIATPITQFGGKANDDTFDNFNAINQAFQSGKPVKFPKGTYRIKTEQSINIASNTQIIFDAGAEIIIDTGFTSVMTNHPFKILVGTENVTFKNFKVSGYKAPTQRSGADGFIDIRGAKNIRFEGKTRIENANTVFLFVWDCDGVYIEDFYGKQCNADGLFIRRSKNVKIGKAIIENAGDDGLSIGYDCFPLVDGSSDPLKPYDVTKCSENVYVDSLEVRGKSPYYFATGSAGLYIGGAKNVYVDKVTVENRSRAFRAYVGHNSAGAGAVGALLDYNININHITGIGLTGETVYTSGYVTDSFDKETYKTLINIGTIFTDSPVNHVLNASVSTSDPTVYFPGKLNIGSVIVNGALSYSTGMLIKNYKNIHIGSIDAIGCDLTITESAAAENISINKLKMRSISVTNGSVNIKLDVAVVLNALKWGLFCSAIAPKANQLEIKNLLIDGFNMNGDAGIYGVQANNTTLTCDDSKIYNNTVSPVSTLSFYIAENSNINFKKVYTKWISETDSNRYATKAGDSTAVFTFDHYQYKNGSNITKILKHQRTGATSSRPTDNLYVGKLFFDTTLSKPIWLKTISPVVWVDSTGTTV